MKRLVSVFAAVSVLAASACTDGDDEPPPTAAPTIATVSVTTVPTTSVPPTTTVVPPTTAAPSTVPPTTNAADAAPRPSAGCGTSPASAVEWQRNELSVRGAERWYLLTVPESHDGETPMPLVLDFHGFSEGAQIHTMMSEMAPAAAQRGFVVALPNGTQEPVRWDTGVDPAANDDLAYVIELLDRLERDLCIDTSRVYATGLSNGAFMSSAIACALPDRVAAVAPVAGATVACETLDRPMPVYAIHGTADPILLFNGGVDASRLPGGDAQAPPNTLPPVDLTGPGYPQAMVDWAARNDCDESYEDRRMAQDVIRRVWDCPAGADTEFVIVEGGGHSWPGSEFSSQIESIIGPTTESFAATDTMWDFFDRFTVPE
ncbi:hypothetical protein BH24ACT6_BH24ACT6_16000 [soil metagenome]